MRSSLFLALSFMLLLPAAVAAQRHPSDLGAIKQAPPSLLLKDQAVATALAKVRNDLVNDQLSTWGAVRIRPSTIAATATLFNATSGRGPVYVVAVTAPNARGHVRVVVNAGTGEVMSTQLTTWDWGNAPTWWQRGEKSPPPAVPAR